MVLVVVLKLQFVCNGETSSHSVGDIGTGLISTVTLVGEVYTVDDGVPYCSVDERKQN